MNEVITNDGVRLSYRDSGGDGVPLVMLHGWGQTLPLLFDHCAQNWRDLLDRIDVPVLVLGCEGSHVDPASQRFVAGRIPWARLHVFPKSVASSYFPFLENPGAFNAVVEKFLP